MPTYTREIYANGQKACRRGCARPALSGYQGYCGQCAATRLPPDELARAQGRSDLVARKALRRELTLKRDRREARRGAIAWSLEYRAELGLASEAIARLQDEDRQLAREITALRRRIRRPRAPKPA
jgi:hypothetical protein